MLKRLKTYLFPAIVILGIVAFSLTGRNEASGADYKLDREPEIIAATFESAWCSACKILKPRLADVMPDFADKPVKFVSLDFTFGQRGAIEDQARAEGLAEVYPRFKGATGFTLLVDKGTGEIIDSLTINHTKPAMRAAIAQALAVAARDQSADAVQ